MTPALDLTRDADPVPETPPQVSNWVELTAARDRLDLTNREMAQLLGVSLSTYEGWGQRGRVPRYIQHSVQAHLALSPATLRDLLSQRR